MIKKNDTTLENNAPFQLWKTHDTMKLVREALKVTHDEFIREQRRGWFPRMIRAALVCYIAYCKTVAEKVESNG